MNKGIDQTKDELVRIIQETGRKIDGTNTRMDRLYGVIVKRDEHERLEFRISKLEHDVAEISVKWKYP